MSTLLRLLANGTKRLEELPKTNSDDGAESPLVRTRERFSEASPGLGGHGPHDASQPHLPSKA